MGIISLTVTCGLLVASHWRREATKYARWIAFTGSKWTFSLKLMRRPLEIPLHHITSVYLCIYAEQWIIKWEEVRLNRCGNLVLAESCTSSFTCAIMCTAAETSEATHRISVSLCFSEWCEDLRVGVCVCFVAFAHLWELFYFLFCCILVDYAFSLKPILSNAVCLVPEWVAYVPRQFLFIFFFLNLPLCLEIAAPLFFVFFPPPDMIFVKVRFHHSIRTSISRTDCVWAGFVRLCRRVVFDWSDKDKPERTRTDAAVVCEVTMPCKNCLKACVFLFLSP